MHIGFVTASGGNHFMTELLMAVAHEVTRPGVETTISVDEFPPEESTDAYVVIPHEYFACAPTKLAPSRRQLSRTISLCVEQPGTKWFEFSFRAAVRTAAIFDIAPMAVRELRRRGVPAIPFQLGYSRFWDSWHRDEGVERDLDVLFLGSHTDRRERLIAGYGGPLWSARTRFLLPAEAPKTGPSHDFLVDDDKRRQLRGTRVLLNLHRQESPYFEWVRVLEAICNGCVVVSEHSHDHAPLVPGRHLVAGAAESLGLMARALLADPDRLRRLRLDAYDLVRSELPMRPAADRLTDVAEHLTRSGLRRRRSGAELGLHVARAGARFAGAREQLRVAAGTAAVGAVSAAKQVILQDPELAWLFRGASELDFQIGKLRAATKRVALEQLAIQRQYERARLLEAGLDPEEPVEVHTTPAYADTEPAVSILVPLHNYADQVQEALASAAASAGPSLELIVLDDASTDDSRAVAARFLTSRPGLPGRLVAHPYNRGLGCTRNALLGLARAPLAFFLDADNAIYPTALERLVAGLHADPEALFAYGIIAKFRGPDPSGLLSFKPWDPWRLRKGNYIDAMALFRTRRLVELGGFDEDVRMTGWEDYDLWCRCAEHGEHGTLVPQIVARYRESEHSMLSLTGIDHQVNWSILSNRYPRLLRGAPMPWQLRSLHAAEAES